MRTGIVPVLAILLCSASPAMAGQATTQSVVDNKIGVVPGEKGANVEPFGKGALIKRPEEPTASVRPFGNGVIVKEPGRPDVICSRLGSRMRCR